jgi:hypothetical protein
MGYKKYKKITLQSFVGFAKLKPYAIICKFCINNLEIGNLINTVSSNIDGKFRSNYMSLKSAFPDSKTHNIKLLNKPH